MRLTLNGINHRYGDMPVLSDIELEIPAGEIICIIGPSGCGKSTLLRLIGGLEQPDEGAVLAHGAAPADSLNPLTYIFQDFALLPWRSVAGNVSLVLEDHGLGSKIGQSPMMCWRAPSFPTSERPCRASSPAE